MDNLEKFMVEWVKDYYKFKDIHSKSIKNIKINSELCTVTIESDVVRVVLVRPSITTKFLKDIKKYENNDRTLVVVNNRRNLDVIIELWDELIKFSAFNIIFLNPFSHLQQKWIVFPLTHHGISEGEVSIGLNSLFSNVEPITEKEFLEKINYSSLASSSGL